MGRDGEGRKPDMGERAAAAAIIHHGDSNPLARNNSRLTDAVDNGADLGLSSRAMQCGASLSVAHSQWCLG